jgi:hypothetical protein
MFRSMKEIVNLLDEADEARLLATKTQDRVSALDLLQYATALEAEAARLSPLRIGEGLAERIPDRYRSPIFVSPV